MRVFMSLFMPFLLLAGPLHAADEIRSARFTEPTTRYDHGILGDAVEWGALELETPGGTITLRLPETHVFEDLAPRLVDVDGDGDSEVMVVETDRARGASLALYDATGRIAATPPIGQPYRWLAPLGAADLDGDGLVEIAYVDRPHLAKTLRIWRFERGALTELAAYEGVTNHRIGWDYIAGGIRDCGEGPEMVLASGDWKSLVTVRLEGGALVAETRGPWSQDAAQAALTCR